MAGAIDDFSGYFLLYSHKPFKLTEKTESVYKTNQLLHFIFKIKLTSLILAPLYIF